MKIILVIKIFEQEKNFIIQEPMLSGRLFVFAAAMKPMRLEFKCLGNRCNNFFFWKLKSMFDVTEMI